MCKRNACFCLAIFSSGLLLAALAQIDAQQKKKGKTEYVFQPDEKRRVLLARSPFFYEGHLNDLGAFVPDPKAPPIEMKVSQEEGFAWIEALEKRKFPIFNMHRGGLRVDVVYQYLSEDWLVLGSLGGGGEDFLPQIKNNTIELTNMADYLKSYDPDSHFRIYNLPGRIVKKAER